MFRRFYCVKQISKHRYIDVDLMRVTPTGNQILFLIQSGIDDMGKSAQKTYVSNVSIRSVKSTDTCVASVGKSNERRDKATTDQSSSPSNADRTP